MYDFIYLGVSVGFFAAMLVYVHLCRKLAQRSERQDPIP